MKGPRYMLFQQVGSLASQEAHHSTRNRRQPHTRVGGTRGPAAKRRSDTHTFDDTPSVLASLHVSEFTESRLTPDSLELRRRS